MGLVKITQADRWFSLCVRERAGWKCESCGKQYEKGAQGLHCSHIWSRRHKATRHHPANAVAHCFACHQRLGGDPVAFTAWARAHLGEDLFERLERAHRELVKATKGRDKEIAAHFKKEWEKLMRRRYAGETGRIEFEAYREA